MGKECSQTGPKPEETLLTAASRRVKSASDLACDVHSEGNDSCVFLLSECSSPSSSDFYGASTLTGILLTWW